MSWFVEKLTRADCVETTGRGIVQQCCTILDGMNDFIG